MGSAPSRTDPAARGRLSLPVVVGETATPVPVDFVRSDDKTLTDSFARRVRYLRVSVTDRCNYACTYCVPEDGIDHQARADVLTFEEIERVVALFVQLGVERVRLTGGEPTVRANVTELVARLHAHVPTLVMTSNGHRLPELAQPLAAAGLAEVNVSIDTLEADRFARLTTRGDLSRVIAGIDAAIAAGLRVKLNAVALADENQHELAALCQFAWARGVAIRFIEHMPLSGGQLYQADRELSAATIRTTLANALGPLTPVTTDRRSVGPARYWCIDGDRQRSFGIISAMTEHFCDDCNRVRVTADGALHACLGHDEAVSLRQLMRTGAGDEDLHRAIAFALSGKREGHEFQRTGAGAPGKHMIAVGG